MKPLWVNRKGIITEGELKGKEGLVVGFDSTVDEATIKIDDVSHVLISSDYIHQEE